MKKAKMIEEATKRMRLLKLWDTPEDSIIRRFMETGELFKSIPAMGGRVGKLFTLSDAEESLVQEFEQQNGCLVYHVIRNEVMVNPIGVNVQYSFLYVPDRENEWGKEKDDISGIESRILYPSAYVYSAGDVIPDAEDLSGGFGEFMKIGITWGCGGLCRVY